MDSGKSPTLLKVVILGDGGVGKSSLMRRFVNNEFDQQSFHTIGVEFLNKDVDVDDTTFTMQIWDTAGQERFRSLRTPFYRGTDCCMLTFDVNDAQTFTNISLWRKEFLHYADVRDPSTFPFILLGNKVDQGNRVVTEQQIQQWCAENGGMQFFETSAKDNINVERAFKAAATLMRRADALAPVHAEYSDTITLGKKGNTKPTADGGCAC
jgi:small GTP-binding protein